jgi:hypothetical protein
LFRSASTAISDNINALGGKKQNAVTEMAVHQQRAINKRLYVATFMSG